MKTMFYTVALAVPLLVLVGGEPASASQRALPRSARYDIMKGNLNIGRIQMDVGKPRRGLRPIRIKADIDPLGSTTLGMTIKSVSWLNKRWYPVRAKWDWNSFGNKRSVRASYRKRRVDGKYFREKTLGKHIRTERKHAIGDMVSFAAWLVHQPIEAGKTLRTSTYTGTQLYDITVVPKGVETIDLGGLDVEAERLEITASRPTKSRTMTMWIEPARRTVTKIVMHADLIGDITMILRHTRR